MILLPCYWRTLGTVDTASYWQIVNMGIGMYLIIPFLVCFNGISGLFGLAMSILAGLCLSKCEPWFDQNQYVAEVYLYGIIRYKYQATDLMCLDSYS